MPRAAYRAVSAARCWSRAPAKMVGVDPETLPTELPLTTAPGDGSDDAPAGGAGGLYGPDRLGQRLGPRPGGGGPGGPPGDGGRGGGGGGGRGRHRKGLGWLVAAVVVIVVVVIGVPLVYFNLVEGRTPKAPELAVGPGGRSGPVNGTWSVAGGSLAEYRVQEILFGQHHTAVGSTHHVTGSVTITGATVTAAHFVVDMATVKSNAAGRNVMWNDHIMDTAAYPHADFTLTQPIDLDRVPAPGHIVSVAAVGQLTLRGQTHTVSFPLHAERRGGQLLVQGNLSIRFAEWGIPNPSFTVAQVGDHGTIALLLHFSKG